MYNANTTEGITENNAAFSGLFINHSIEGSTCSRYDAGISDYYDLRILEQTCYQMDRRCGQWLARRRISVRRVWDKMRTNTLTQAINRGLYLGSWRFAERGSDRQRYVDFQESLRGKHVEFLKALKPGPVAAVNALWSAADESITFNRAVWTKWRTNAFGFGDEYRAYMIHRDRLQSGEWKPPVWQNYRFFKDSPLSQTHFCHISEKNPERVAYMQNADKLKRGISTQIRPGRYLKQFFGDVLSEGQIREMAQQHEMKYSPKGLTVLFGKTPDMWEWVYENGHDFTSCMTHKRSGPHLNTDMYGENHPVRSYAHPDSDLAIAYLPTTLEPYPNHAVAARSIVNTKTKQYVRVYGDDRLIRALEAIGYTHSTACIKGQPMLYREYDNGGWILPYLDGGFGYEIDTYNETITIESGAEYDGQSTCGVVGESEDNCVECCHCNDSFDEEDIYCMNDDTHVCESCRDNYYCYAYGRNNNQYWVSKDDAIYCASDGEWYEENYYENYNIECCQDNGQYYHIDDMCQTPAGWYRNAYRGLTQLDVEYDGCEWTLDATVTTQDGRAIHENAAVRCYVTNTTHHEDDDYMVELTIDGTKWWVCLDQISSADLVVFEGWRILTDEDFDVFLLPVKYAPTGATFAEYFEFARSLPKIFTNIGDGDVEITFDAAIKELFNAKQYELAA